VGRDFDREFDDGGRYEAIIKEKDNEIGELGAQLNKYETELDELKMESRSPNRLVDHQKHLDILEA
jgi:hypothetical protein